MEVAVHVTCSVQLLGTSALFDEGERIPDLGVLAGVCHQVLLLPHPQLPTCFLRSKIRRQGKLLKGWSSTRTSS